MPSAARLSHRPARRAAAPAPFGVFDLRTKPAPPSAALVEAIQRFADLEEEAGGGRVRRRVSAYRLAELEARGLIDAPAERAAEIAILWDEREGQIVRVLDDAPAKAAARGQRAWWESLWDEPQLSLATGGRAAR
ncbi:hypothetical protein [Phenylobacterium sp.]|uniref:hypothetical protein n=1 Tax=Phenylobacterium sp. TaxID=1871053 RepID=UPI0035B17D4E